MTKTLRQIFFILNKKNYNHQTPEFLLDNNEKLGVVTVLFKKKQLRLWQDSLRLIDASSIQMYVSNTNKC